MPEGNSLKWPAIGPADLRRLLHANVELAVLDAREEGLFAAAHLLFATCLPLGRLELEAPRLLPRRDVAVIWCDGGEGLAERAAMRLAAFGYSQVGFLAGGVPAWAADGYPVYSGVHVPSKAFAEVLEHKCRTPWITAEQLNSYLSDGADIMVVDSRSFEEYHGNSIPTAISVPGAELVYRVGGLVPSPDTMVVVNCGGRTRSIVGAQALISAGLPNKVVSLKDGTMGWHLAGLPVRRGADGRAPEPTGEQAERAAAAAESLSRQLGVQTLDDAAFDEWRRECGRRTMYVIDVRSPEEYLAGHMPGATGVAGGQLVQETDNWLAVWGARVVLVDNPGLVRARMTAVWLRQLGWKDIAVLPWDTARHGTTSGAYETYPLGWSALDASLASQLEPAALQTLLGDGTIVIDVDNSKSYRAGHVPGAYFARRLGLAQELGQWPTATTFVLTSGDGRLARFAAAELASVATLPVHWLAGGTAAWIAAGLPLEDGDTRLADADDDVWLTPRERRSDTEKNMRDYLEWEVALADQIEADPDSRIEILL